MFVQVAQACFGLDLPQELSAAADGFLAVDAGWQLGGAGRVTLRLAVVACISGAAQSRGMRLVVVSISGRARTQLRRGGKRGGEDSRAASWSGGHDGGLGASRQADLLSQPGNLIAEPSAQSGVHEPGLALDGVDLAAELEHHLPHFGDGRVLSGQLALQPLCRVGHALGLPHDLVGRPVVGVLEGAGHFADREVEVVVQRTGLSHHLLLDSGRVLVARGRRRGDVAAMAGCFFGEATWLFEDVERVAWAVSQGTASSGGQTTYLLLQACPGGPGHLQDAGSEEHRFSLAWLRLRHGSLPPPCCTRWIGH